MREIPDATLLTDGRGPFSINAFRFVGIVFGDSSALDPPYTLMPWGTSWLDCCRNVEVSSRISHVRIGSLMLHQSQPMLLGFRSPQGRQFGNDGDRAVRTNVCTMRDWVRACPARSHTDRVKAMCAPAPDRSPSMFCHLTLGSLSRADGRG